MKDDSHELLQLLLVEDSPADVFLVREAMREEGLDFEMEVAEDGETAIEWLNRPLTPDRPGPNLLVLDLNVPRLNGVQVLAWLRESHRDPEIPVIVISSSDSPHDRKRAFELGATEYFRKPSSLAEFMRLGTLIRRIHAESGPAIRI
jgi:DNA-binding response OmpR family regulator